MLAVVCCCIVPLAIFALFPATRPAWLGGATQEAMIVKPGASRTPAVESITQASSSSSQPVALYDVEVTEEH